MKFSQIVQLAALLPFVANARLFSNKKDPRDLQAAEIHNTTSCNPCHRLDIANELFSSLPPGKFLTVKTQYHLIGICIRSKLSLA